jgi:Spy/CpxP family protein refolding chaperone
MSKGKRVGLAAVLLSAVAGAGVAAAAVDEGGQAPQARQWQGRRGERLAEYLGLTPQQQEQWKALHQQQRERIKPLLEEGRTLRQKLHAALEAQQPDARAVGEATIALHAHRQKLRAQRESFEQQLSGILDPQQKQKLEAFQAARRTMGRGPGGRGFGRPGRAGDPAQRG